MKSFATVLLVLLISLVAIRFTPGVDLRLGGYSFKGGFLPKDSDPPTPSSSDGVGRYQLVSGTYVLISAGSGKSMPMPGIFKIDSKTGKVLKYHMMFAPDGSFLEGWLPTINARPAPRGTPIPNKGYLIKEKGRSYHAATKVGK